MGAAGAAVRRVRWWWRRYGGGSGGQGGGGGGGSGGSATFVGDHRAPKPLPPDANNAPTLCKPCLHRSGSKYLLTAGGARLVQSMQGSGGGGFGGGFGGALPLSTSPAQSAMHACTRSQLYMHTGSGGGEGLECDLGHHILLEHHVALHAVGLTFLPCALATIMGARALVE